MYVEERILNDMQRFLFDYVNVSRETIDIFAEEEMPSFIYERMCKYE